MVDQTALIILVATAVVALGIVCAAALKGWQGWLEVQRLAMRGEAQEMRQRSPGARIEVADLKERVRKLEAIASGIDL